MPSSKPAAGFDTLDGRLARRLVTDHPLEAARFIEQLDSQQVVETLQMVPADAAARVLQVLERGQAAACLAGWPAEQQPQLLGALHPGRAARLLSVLEPSTREAILSTCSERLAVLIRRVSRYPEETAGALMDPDPPAAPGDITVEQARRLFETSAARTHGYLFVVGRDDVLAGFVEVDDLLRAAQTTSLDALRKPAAERLSARADRTAVALHPGWRKHHVLPVVDRREVLVGALDHRTLHEIEGDTMTGRTDPPLSLALGEMYWTLLSTMVEGVVNTVSPREVRPGQEAQR